MSVRIEGDLEFQRWYYRNYGDVTPIISNDIYAEYLEYRNIQRFQLEQFVKCVFLSCSVIGLVYVFCLFFGLFDVVYNLSVDILFVVYKLSWILDYYILSSVKEVVYFCLYIL